MKTGPKAAAFLSALPALLLSARGVFADTGTPITGDQPVITPGLDLGALIGYGVAGLLVVLIAIVSTRRPTWRRPMAAILVAGASLLVALFFTLGALFSDFSGRHEVYPGLLVVALVVLVVGTLVTAGILRRPRSLRPTQDR
jgi:MFS family permease